MSQFVFPHAEGQPNSGNPKGEIDRESSSGRDNDRRQKRRAVISCPVRVRGVDIASRAPDEVSTTVDVSRSGILFVTSNSDFHRSMEVAVTLPYSMSPGVPQSEQFGSIVRVSALSNGKVAVAVAFGLDAVPRTVAAPAAADVIGQTPEDHKSRKPLILLVEADLSARDSLKSYLSTQGYMAIAVGDALQGREVLNAITPALVIAEIEGEGLPGFELCIHIKATPRLKHIPVMLTTSSAYPTDYSNAHSLGAVVCIAKPYRLDRIAHVVRLLVPHSRAGT